MVWCLVLIWPLAVWAAYRAGRWSQHQQVRAYREVTCRLCDVLAQHGLHDSPDPDPEPRPSQPRLYHPDAATTQVTRKEPSA